jgi:adenine-specific DNA-methyltransferase
MAHIEDEISRIQDTELRKTLLKEVRKLKEKRQFGLVFEEHLPEVVPINSASVRPRARVAQRTANLTETYHVLSINNGQAELVKDADSSRETLPIESLVVIRQFGEAIYPALVPMGKVENGGDAPYHTLIEADNYHALQLLEYLYEGEVDCIYIDPPYNTGARDWKYNNDYVDRNDTWRHSKWLSMMKKRLLLAKELLKPDTGVLMITIDEHEVHHLGMLLEQVFPDTYRQMVTIVVNPKGVAQGRLSRVEEYAMFCFMGGAFVRGVQDDLLTKDNNKGRTKAPRWAGLLRSGTEAKEQTGKTCFIRSSSIQVARQL